MTNEETAQYTRAKALRLMMYFAAYPVRKCIDVFKKFFGAKEVDSTIYYYNWKEYMTSVFCCRTRMVSTWYDGGVWDDTIDMSFGDIIGSVRIAQPSEEEKVYETFLRIRERDKNMARYFVKWVSILCIRHHDRHYGSEIENTGAAPSFREPLIYVHIPKATVILNENDLLKHDIYDMFFSVSCTYGLLGDKRTSLYHNQTSIRGARTTFTAEEVSYQYVHSHRPDMSCDYPLSFENQCTGGNGTPLNQLVVSIKGYMRNRNVHELSKALTELFCINLKTYVGVESNAGGAYKHIDRLGTSSVNPVYRQYVKEQYTISSNFLDKMLEVNGKYHFVKFVASKTQITYGMTFTDIAFALSDLVYVTQKELSNVNPDWYVKAALAVDGNIVHIANNGYSIPSRMLESRASIVLNGKVYRFKEHEATTDRPRMRVLKQAYLETFFIQFISHVNKKLQKNETKQNQMHLSSTSDGESEVYVRTSTT